MVALVLVAGAQRAAAARYVAHKAGAEYARESTARGLGVQHGVDCGAERPRSVAPSPAPAALLRLLDGMELVVEGLRQRVDRQGDEAPSDPALELLLRQQQRRLRVDGLGNRGLDGLRRRLRLRDDARDERAQPSLCGHPPLSGGV